MDLNYLQNEIRGRGEKLGIKLQTPVEIMLGATEELGEVAKEVALFEQVGNKINWKRSADKDLLAEEIAQLLVNIFSLASSYDINVEEALQKLFEGKNK
jgi:NTP pyrophosphatase (non-canonical NTP hydrolase)